MILLDMIFFSIKHRIISETFYRTPQFLNMLLVDWFHDEI